jgi:hypothetical protein
MTKQVIGVTVTDKLQILGDETKDVEVSSRNPMQI